jgi:hypothetical protein
LGLTNVAEARALDTKEFSSLKKKAKHALKAGDMTTLAARITDLGADDSKRAIEFMLDMAKVPDGNVYDAATKAIAGMTSEEAEDFIAGKMAKGGGSTFGAMLLIDAMGERADTFAGVQLGAACSAAKKPEIQRACIGAIKNKRLKSGLSGMIDLFKTLEKKSPDGLNTNMIREILEKMTGESFETAADWKNFWEPRKNNFKRPTTGGKARGNLETARRKKRPTFFGSEIKSDRLVFVIDTSGSMMASNAGGGMMGGGAPGGAASPDSRIEKAKAQLIGAIDALGPKTRFTIVAYSGVLTVGQGGVPTEPPGTKPNGLLPPKIANIEWRKTWKGKLMPANDKSKASAKAFVKSLKAEGGTFTLNAIKAAFEIKGMDTIVLLSDGMPSEFNFKAKRQMSTDDILGQVSTMNRTRRIVIDTFGFDAASGNGRKGRPQRGGHRRGSGGAGPAGAPGGGGPVGSLGKFMQDLANQNAGGYTQIK